MFAVMVIATASMMAATTYWITQVDQPSNRPITKVCAFEPVEQPDGKLPAGIKLSAGIIKPYTRQQVVNGLQAGTAQFFTCTRNADNNWKKGAAVVLTDDGKYITTVGNNTTRDNLGNLPPCTC